MGKRTTGQAPQPAAPAVELFPVEELFERFNTPAWQRAGLMRAMRWASGKRVSEQTLRDALTTWLKKPVGR